jgi:hypothetical protein
LLNTSLPSFSEEKLTEITAFLPFCSLLPVRGLAFVLFLPCFRSVFELLTQYSGLRLSISYVFSINQLLHGTRSRSLRKETGHMYKFFTNILRRFSTSLVELRELHICHILKLPPSMQLWQPHGRAFWRNSVYG